MHKKKYHFPLIGIRRLGVKDLAILCISLFLLLGFLRGCSRNTLSKKDIESMKAKYLLEYGKPPALWPVMVGLKEECDIFSVPEEDAVATNCLNNAITLLRFDKDKIKYDEVRRDFIDGVGSGDKFYPGIFSDQWIGYTQTRGFLLFNLKKKSFADHIPIKSGDDFFTDVKTYDGIKLQFLFQVCHPYFDEGKRFLKLIEFDGKGGFKQISEIEAGTHKGGCIEPWAIQNKTIFVYNNDSTRITAYDINFGPISHPFCDLFNNLKDFRRLGQITIHPSFPIAVLVEINKEDQGNYKVWLARWQHPDPDQRFIELLGQHISMFSTWRNLKELICSQFEFSPDGKWLVFRDDSEMVLQSIANPTFVAMPVDGSREMPLGNPKILGKVMRDYAWPTSTAWITKPVSFVACDGKIVYKWELDSLHREFGK
jgi:hypothetical protein